MDRVRRAHPIESFNLGKSYEPQRRKVRKGFRKAIEHDLQEC